MLTTNYPPRRVLLSDFASIADDSAVDDLPVRKPRADFDGKIYVFLLELMGRYRIQSRSTLTEPTRWQKPRSQGGRGFPPPLKRQRSRAVCRWLVADILKWEDEERSRGNDPI